MFFLIRCAFWLGLVYLAMARDAGAFEAFFKADASTTTHMARSLDAMCEAAPNVCLKAAERATGAAFGVAADAASRERARASRPAAPARG